MCNVGVEFTCEEACKCTSESELEVRVQTTEYTSMVLKYIVMDGKLVKIGIVMIIRVISVISVVGKSKENAEIIRTFQIING